MANFFWTTTPDDTWHWGGYDSRNAALAEGRKEHPGETIHTGILSPANALDMMPDGSDLLDHLRNDSSDHGDADGDWLAHVSKEAEEDLGKRVQAVILAWLEEQGELPTFGLIVDSETHPPEPASAEA